ncbi:MAG: hypothetical protein CL524_13240, partial [Aequorivita sp.]|nr:hypothetical protein [Aequorivita sp.]
MVYSYVGFENREVRVGADTIINVSLLPSASLNGVVVTAYSVSNDAIRNAKGYGIRRNKSYNSNLERKLQGKAAGVQVTNSNVGASPSFVIRGTSSNISNPVSENESYGRIEENIFKSVTTAPLSTFSIDVDKAGYSNIRRMLNNGQKVPEDAVKIEEMVNYFAYDYPQPKGDDLFSITADVVNSPWNADAKLVRIGLKGKDISLENVPPSNLVFLLDVSGSMDSPNKLPLLKAALNILVDKLREKDKVAIVVYAGAAGLVLPPTSGAEKAIIRQAIDNLSAGGSTAGG